MKTPMLVFMEQNVVSIYRHIITLIIQSCLANTCKIRKISGKVHLNIKKRKLILKFSSNYEAKGVMFECKLNDQKYIPCELLNYVATIVL